MLSHRSQKTDTGYGNSFPYPGDRTVGELVEAQAAALPAQPALTFGEVTITYGELDRYATGTARTLYELGVRNGDFVPLVMGGGLALPIAMIAAMKIGSPFVPVDSAWPQERIASVLGLLRPKVIVTDQPGKHRSPPGIPSLHLDAGKPPASAAGNPCSPPAIDDLIYGFFTSGSTGTPKCALNRHRGLVNRFLYMTRRFSSDGQIVLQNSHHVFDSSIWQLLWPLTRGGRVIVPDRTGILDLERTIEVIGRHGVTMTDFVPSIFNTMTAMLAADPRLTTRLGSLRRILIGGEEVDGETVRILCGLLPELQVTNTYGPTEASIGSVFHDITVADGGRVPLGRPIDNTYAVILNNHLEPVPAGAIGGIYLGGDCLGAGYLDDPAKTAAAFVPNTLPQIPGSLLYRTGDLGYQREDGMFMFAGRADDQVKVGGVRIEMAEVEAALTKHPAVRQAKVLVHGSTLIGFVAADGQVTPAALTEHARTLLPGSSVPRRIIVQDRLPLTPNGKLDRQELARRARQVAAPAQDGPLTATERAIKRIWLGLLECDDVGAAQSLFDAGGDSLTAQRLALALKRHFRVNVTVHDVASAPAIRDQAGLIARRSHAGSVPVGQDAAFLQSEVRLARDIACSGPGFRVGRPDRFFLTGVTGFVGAHLVHELLKQRPDAIVYGLIRADGVPAARDRLARALDRYGLPGSVLRNLVAVPGDLSSPRFGLDQAEFERLAGSVDAIIHNGALVNLIRDYASHRPANVTGTAEVVRLAATSLPKHLHYVSTLSVFPFPGSGRPPIAEREIPGLPVPEDGYSQSKWVAEKILALARTRGVPCTVYRLGEVMPHSTGGAPNPRSILGQLLRACACTGLGFATPAVTDWTPVDTVSRFIAAAATVGQAWDDCYHVLLPSRIPVARVMRTLAENSPLSEVPYPEFWINLCRASQSSGDRELRKLLSVLPDPQAGPAPELLTGLFSDAAANFGATRAARLARELGVSWPDGPDDDAIAAFCRTVSAAVSVGNDRLAPTAE